MNVLPDINIKSSIEPIDLDKPKKESFRQRSIQPPHKVEVSHHIPTTKKRRFKSKKLVPGKDEAIRLICNDSPLLGSRNELVNVNSK
jgi:hypothetical protein